MSDSGASHSITIYKAVNIGTNEDPIIGDWTVAAIIDSEETFATISSTDSSSYTWTMAGANYFKIQVDLLYTLGGYSIRFDSIIISYSY